MYLTVSPMKSWWLNGEIENLWLVIIVIFPSLQLERPSRGVPAYHTVDGSEIRRSPVEVGSLSHYLQGFVDPRWLFRTSTY